MKAELAGLPGKSLMPDTSMYPFSQHPPDEFNPSQKSNTGIWIYLKTANKHSGNMPTRNDCWLLCIPIFFCFVKEQYITDVIHF